jgi:hypothetical protein
MRMTITRAEAALRDRCTTCKRPRALCAFPLLPANAKTCLTCKAKAAARRVPKFVRADANPAPLILDSFLPMGADVPRVALVWRAA